MHESLRLDSIARLVEELLAAADGTARDRVLIEAAFALEAARAAAIWKRSGPRGEERSWRAVLERGPADALPRPTLVEAALEGVQDRNLPGRGVALRIDGAELALVLGEVENPDGRVDLLEALLHLCAVLSSGGSETGGSAGLASLLPDEGEAPEAG